jgi:hypothetical protein
MVRACPQGYCFCFVSFFSAGVTAPEYEQGVMQCSRRSCCSWQQCSVSPQHQHCLASMSSSQFLVLLQSMAVASAACWLAICSFLRGVVGNTCISATVQLCVHTVLSCTAVDVWGVVPRTYTQGLVRRFQSPWPFVSLQETWRAAATVSSAGNSSVAAQYNNT